MLIHMKMINVKVEKRNLKTQTGSKFLLQSLSYNKGSGCVTCHVWTTGIEQALQIILMQHH